MTKAELLKTAGHVVRAYGFRSFADLYTLVIHRGYRAEDGRSVLQFRALERAFHTAQMLRWAADETDKDARAYWVHVAAKRLAPMNAETWRGMPEAIKRAA